MGGSDVNGSRIALLDAAPAPVPSIPAAPAAPAGPVSIAGPVTTAFKPKEAYDAVVNEGANRMNLPWKLLLAQSILAGTCVALGGFLFCSCGADAAALNAANPGLGRLVSGAVGWPVAIILATFTGSSPFTANLLFVFQALFAGRGTPLQGAKVLGVTWVGCFLGALFCAAICVAGAAPAIKGATAIALRKALMPFSVVFFRSIFAGWLIGLAVVLATTSQDAVSKMAGIWLCISTYVICEFDHMLSNMVLFQIAMLAGADIAPAKAAENLLASTLGNGVGAGLCVAGLLCLVHSGLLAAKQQRPQGGLAGGAAGAAGGAAPLFGAAGARGSVSASAFGGLRLPSLRRRWRKGDQR